MIASSFTKLFSSITDSSIWSEDSDTKVVWVTMLAMSDQFGRVNAAVPGLAKRSGVSIEATQKALEKFLSPDPYSRTKDHEGKRIEVIQGGWRLLNHEFYREIRSEEDRKEQNRQAQQRRRDKKRQQTVSKSQQNQPRSAHTDTEADADTNKKTNTAEKTFSDLWVAEYHKFHGTKYMYQGAKDAQACKKLVSIEDPHSLMVIAGKAWRNKAGFNSKFAASIASFASRFNEIRAEVGTSSKSGPVLRPTMAEHLAAEEAFNARRASNE